MQCFPIKTSFTMEFLKENLKELNCYVLLKWGRRGGEGAAFCEFLNYLTCEVNTYT